EDPAARGGPGARPLPPGGGAVRLGTHLEDRPRRRADRPQQRGRIPDQRLFPVLRRRAHSGLYHRVRRRDSDDRVVPAAAARAPSDTVAALNDLRVHVREKRFPAVGEAPPLLALREFHLTAAQGEFVCLLGPSGCGKTTLLNIVAGLDRDFDGQVSLPVRRAGQPPVIGYVFQTPRLLPWRTVLENIELVISPAERRSGIVDEILAATRLDDV